MWKLNLNVIFTISATLFIGSFVIENSDYPITSLIVRVIGVFLFLFAILCLAFRKRCPEPKIKRDIQIIDVIFYIKDRKWGTITSSIKPLDAPKFKIALNEICQAGLDGKLPIWGKVSTKQTWEEIEPNYWENSQLDFNDFLKSKNNNAAFKNRTFAGRRPSEYHSLMTSKIIVEELWPLKK